MENINNVELRDRHEANARRGLRMSRSTTKTQLSSQAGRSDGGSQWYKREYTEESQSGSNILMRQRGADDNAARLAAVILI